MSLRTQKAEVMQNVDKSRSSHLLDSLRTLAYVIGTSVICIIAVHNSLVWHVQRWWGVSGDFWQVQWERVFDWFDGDAFAMAVYGSTVLSMVVFFTANGLLTIIDMTEWQPLFKYKIQPKEHVSGRRLLSALARVIFNQTVIATPVYLIGFKLAEWRGCDFGRQLPTFEAVLLQLVVFVIVEEFAFYYSHRLAHTPALYKRIHKIHHEWTAPIGITAMYAHPLEHVMSNLGPVMLGPMLCGSHVATAGLWYCLALISTTISHSGYHFPLLPSPEAHDFHHLTFNQNYGVLGVLDRLHGTDAKFRASKAYERHFMALSLVCSTWGTSCPLQVPMRQMVPDADKKTMFEPK